MLVACCPVISAGQDAAQPPPPAPSADQQAAMIAEVRQNALSYSRTLPDFICMQLTHRYSAPAKTAPEPAWALRDTLTIRLSYFGQKEDYRVVEVNGRRADKTLGQVRGWTTKGDFGSMLRGVFGPKSETRFEWQRWDTWRGKPVAVLGYSIDRAHSQFNSSGARFLHTVRANWGASGLALVDMETLRIVRLTVDSTDMPRESPTKEVHISLEYAYQKIGEHEFLLPSQSMSLMTVGEQIMRLDSQFTSYQKFSADTEIKYGPETEEKPPAKK